MAKRPWALLTLVLILATAVARSSGPPLELRVESFSAPHSFFSAWTIKKWAGVVNLAFRNDAAGPFLDLNSDSSSWLFIRKMPVELIKTPVITWRWKTAALPPGADGRVKDLDDQAALLYIVFPGKGFLSAMETRVLGYSWETVPSRGTTYTSTKNKDTRFIVLRSSKDPLDTWQTESRDVALDFKALFGEEPPAAPKAIAFQIDSDDTRALAKSAISDIRFISR